MDANNLDYSSLSLPLTKEQKKAYDQKYPYNNRPQIIAGWITTVSVLLIGIPYIILSGFDIAAITGVATVSIVLVLSIIVTRPLQSGLRSKQARLLAFAEMNNLRVLLNSPAVSYPGVIFNLGETRIINEAFVFGEKFEVGNYAYSYGTKDDAAKTIWGYIRFPLNRTSPHIILDATKNDPSKKLRTLSSQYSADQALTLEGDFNDHFTVYVPKGYEQDALYILTSDVMAALVDFAADYDIEIVENVVNLYVPTSIPIESEEFLKKTIDAVEIIREQIQNQNKRYADARVGNRAANSVAVPGQRLKANKNIGKIIAIAAAALFIFVIAALGALSQAMSLR